MKLNLRFPQIPQGIVPDGRDLHIYGGLALVAWGLVSSPAPWLAGILVGAALWWFGVFRLSNITRE